MPLNEKFTIELKSRIKESGLVLKNEFVEMIQDTIEHLPAIMGNEVLIATISPLLQTLYYDEFKRKIFQDNVSDISERLKDKTVNEIVNTLHGRKIFQETINRILEEIDQEKIEAHKELLLKSYTIKDPDEVLLQSCLNTLKNIQPIEIQLLKNFADPHNMISTILEKECKGKTSHIQVDIIKKLPMYFNIDESLCQSAFIKLENEGLIKENPSKPIRGGYGDNNYKQTEEFETRTRDMVTSYGRKFLFLTANISMD